MLNFIAMIHVLIALLLIVFVLLQDPKGGAMGVFGGGSSSSIFGATGASSFFTTATKFLAIAFAITCFSLAYMTTTRSNSVLDQVELPAAGAAQPLVPAEPAVPVESTEPAATPEKSSAPADTASE